MSRSFNLLRQPWVKVSDASGMVTEMSTVEVYEKAPVLVGVVGEMPTQAAAVLRLHLAIAYRALRHDLTAEDTVDEWEQWWRAGSLPVARIVDYLQRYEGRFDLFDATAPFMQVADLHTASGKTSGLSKLIAEVPDGHQYFTTRAGTSLESISPAEAARWLVHLQSYDPSGIKTGAVGDPSVKGGRGYPIGQGWGGRIGLVLVEGQTLSETLLLNLVHSHPSDEPDRPVWEREPQTAAADVVAVPEAGGEPRGTVDLLTWQVRRVRLIPGEEAVVDSVIANGDRITPQNRQLLELATAYRFSDNQTKQHRGDVYMPLEHRPEQALWRGLASLFAKPESQGERKMRIRPPVLEWLDAVSAGGVVEAGHPVRVRAIGMEYGSQASSVAGVIDDALAFQFGAVTQPQIKAEVVAAAEATQRGVRELERLAGNLVRAAGSDAVGARDRAAELGFGALDGPFRRWLATLSPEVDLDAQVECWHRTARRILTDAARELIEASGTPALRGRLVSGRQGAAPTLMDAGLADTYFRRGLAVALDRGLPRQYPETSTKESA